MPADRTPGNDDPLARQRERLADYRFGLRVGERGKVVSVGDGVAWIDGLPSAAIDEIVAFDDGSEAVVFQLEPTRVGAILLRQSPQLKAGVGARLPGSGLRVGVGDALLGRIVDPLGLPLDGLGPLDTVASRALDGPSPAIVARDFVSRPLYTGNKIVDTMIPIGKGQRQLVIGDNGVGKTAFALDTVIHQRTRNVRCVYVLVGQKRSSVVQAMQTLRDAGALDYTTLVVAEATAMPGLKYLAPFAGCAIAEHWSDEGRDTLVVYDDLSTHARAYRELSLLLRHPPGREAFPGDIFYLHARLLERSTSRAPASGGGSMTALPIVETEQGEIAAYIPTNLISITDGQIYLDTALFERGTLPAIDVTRSVSRIGGKAQDAPIKKEAGRIKLDYLQFLELEVFTRFGTRLEAAMQQRIRRGQLLRRLLLQDRLDPLPIEFQLGWLLAYNEGLLDGLDEAALRGALDRLRSRIVVGDLPLEAPRAQWVALVRASVGVPPEGPAPSPTGAES
ncbi:MAG: F0F1 ATP synthase subunit alpha [Burkholderiaceae bacterium]|nr:F0F1 ATP synthase subunit alpha [Burkholderiaceae bacterium]